MSALALLAVVAMAIPPDAAYEQAREAFAAECFEDALVLLDEAIEADPQPTYIYNRARVLDALGRFGEARRTFLRVTAIPDVEADLKRLALDQARTLKEAAETATLRFDGLAPGDLAQIDDRLIPRPKADQRLSPGEHQICVLRRGRITAACWRRSLPKGERTAWPFPGSAARGTLVLARPAASIRLDGALLLLDARRLGRLEVDAGTHELRIDDALGRRTVAVDVLPGKVLPVPEPSNDGAAAGVTQPLESRGPWPWITVGTGVAVAAGGGTLLAITAGAKTPDPDQTQVDHQAAWGDAQTQWTVGLVLVGVGTAALVGGAVWALTGDDDSQALWIAPALDGLAIGGTF